MVRMNSDGLNNTPKDHGWYAYHDFTCPRCYASWRIDETDFNQGSVPLQGVLFDFPIAWTKLNSVGTILPYTSRDPDAVNGYCPWCGYHPIYVQGPDFGAIGTAGPTNPVLGILQGYVLAGVTQIQFYDLGGLLIGAFMMADNTFYLYNDTTKLSRSIVRIDLTLDPTWVFLTTAPVRFVSQDEARTRDPALCSLLDGAGIAILSL